MFTQEEQLQIALEVMQRLQAEAAAGPQTGLAIEGPVSAEPFSHPAPFTDTAGRELPLLSSLIRKIGPQPPFSALIGLCEDGLPFLFDLADPRPGAILIAGDPGSGKTRLLQAILASTALLNGPEEVCFSILTSRPEECAIFPTSVHCLGVLSAGELPAGGQVLDLAQMANQRRSGHESGPITILAIDDLAALSRILDDKTARYLQWLLEYGPACGVWTVATIEADRAKQVNRRLLPGFGTRLIGKISSPTMAAHLSGYPDPIVEALEEGRQFCTLFGNEWIRFWIPEMR